ncbi:MAG: SDR family NAD(P)-dependent oxidoreductase, partial [Myxococcota bacterium]
VDLVVVNAGIAAVGAIADLDDETVWRATEVNFVGALRTLREAARLFAVQQVGGDVVVVSTKNVAAPGASFGAYSATKAAAHQLARVAALELAPLGVRVNLVAPDAVFAEGAVRSGLWAEVGPGRAKARGLDPAALPAFYRDRNLLKVEVTGSHVGHAVVFLASGRVPTTGAILPIDGGLPDAFLR